MLIPEDGMNAAMWAAGGAVAGWIAALAAAHRRRPVTPQPELLQDLENQIRALGAVERRVLAQYAQRKPVAEDMLTHYGPATFGQRLADRVAALGGSWTFIVLFLMCLVVWMLINVRDPKPFDPYPFILLNLVLSCLAALQAPVIMMSQNRQAAKDRLDAQNDYRVNLKAEMEILSLHNKLDEAREQDLRRVIDLQERQVRLLESALRDRLSGHSESGE
jgi:uncharacterized membrane protein